MFTMLKRVEPAEQMDRWYMVAVQATLFEPVAVICAWGSRHTAYQQVRILSVTGEAEARALAAQIVATKCRRGYEVVNQEP